MHARALKNIMQLPMARRLDAIAEGLELLVEHVSTLNDDLAFLAAEGRSRGAGALEAQAQEEAAKVLILLDLVRMGWRDQKLAARQISRFYDHLARCIYAEVSKMRPAKFSEIRSLVDDMRETHYLDGPNDMDWIFRNRLLSSREEDLYVDYVQHEDGATWVTPAQRHRLGFWPNTAVQKLVLGMHRSGVTSRQGLDVLASVWSGQVIENATRWPVVAGLNHKVLAQLHDDGVVLPEGTSADARRVINQWTFPLHGLELREIDVKIKDLQDRRERRERAFAAQMGHGS